MTKTALNPYVGRIVKAILKDGTYHVGELVYMPSRQYRWGESPDLYTIGQATFTASDVKYVFIAIGG